MKILVTGGAGFIGSALIRHIIKNTDYFVVNVDALTYAGNLSSIKSVNNKSRYKFEKIDIRKAIQIKKVLIKHQPDIIINLAAETHVDRSIDNPFEFISTNIIGTYVLLEQCRSYWQGLRGSKKNNFRLLHVSTDEVYGDLSLINYKKKSFPPLSNENSSYLPSSPYSASKAASDHLMRAWFRTYNFPSIISISSNNYGPYQFPEKLIPLLILNAYEGKSLPIYGDGKQIRDWLYVEDHASALLLVATKGKIGETYNIGGNNEKKNIEVVRTICKILNEIFAVKKNQILKKLKKGIKKYENLITFVKDRPGHDRHYAVDSNKIKNELGWFPKENFETGIYKTVLWYINNIDWCKLIEKNKFFRKRIGTL